MMMIVKAILKRINHCDGGRVTTKEGGLFLNPLDASQSLRYSHKIFAPCTTAELATPSDIFGFSPIMEYLSIFQMANGLTLFDNALYIYGLTAQISRSIALQDQRAPFVGGFTSEFRAAHRDAFSAGWRPIGAVVIHNKVWLALSDGGKAGIFYEDQAYCDFGLYDLLIGLVVLLENKIGCLPSDIVNGSLVEREVLEFAANGTLQFLNGRSTMQ